MKTNIVYADLSEILFEGRNKSYGGYFLRKTTDANMIKGLVAATAMFLLLFLFFRNTEAPIEAINFNTPHVLTKVEILLDEKTIAPKPPVKQAGPSAPVEKNELAPKPETSQLITPTPKPDDQVKKEVTMQPVDSVKANPGPETGPGTGPPGPGTGTGTSGTGIGGPGTGPTEDNTIYEFTGGLSVKPRATNMKVLKECVHYPDQLDGTGFVGKVEIRILVNKEGVVEEVKVAKSNHPLFAEACKPCMKKLNFEAGKMGEFPVKVWVTIPFVFNPPN